VIKYEREGLLKKATHGGFDFMIENPETGSGMCIMSKEGWPYKIYSRRD
jgi:hypothetical protein